MRFRKKLEFEATARIRDEIERFEPVHLTSTAPDRTIANPLARPPRRARWRCPPQHARPDHGTAPAPSQARARPSALPLGGMGAPPAVKAG